MKLFLYTTADRYEIPQIDSAWVNFTKEVVHFYPSGNEHSKKFASLYGIKLLIYIPLLRKIEYGHISHLTNYRKCNNIGTNLRLVFFLRIRRIGVTNNKGHHGIFKENIFRRWKSWINMFEFICNAVWVPVVI